MKKSEKAMNEELMTLQNSICEQVVNLVTQARKDGKLLTVEEAFAAIIALCRVLAMLIGDIALTYELNFPSDGKFEQHYDNIVDKVVDIFKKELIRNKEHLLRFLKES